eukprot:scaffold549_cov385-Prasinococcus_capsulatus_cf.AAC.2
MKRILILEKVFDPHQSPDRDELEAPPCAPEALDLCIGQMINDMEDAIMVLDMRLLAQLCLCREEIRRVGKVAPSAAQLPEVRGPVQSRGPESEARGPDRSLPRGFATRGPLCRWRSRS